MLRNCTRNVPEQYHLCANKILCHWPFKGNKSVCLVYKLEIVNTNMIGSRWYSQNGYKNHHNRHTVRLEVILLIVFLLSIQQGGVISHCLLFSKMDTFLPVGYNVMSSIPEISNFTCSFLRNLQFSWKPGVFLEA